MPMGGRVVGSANATARVVPIAAAVARSVATPPIVGVPYNSDIAYNAVIIYEQGDSVGSAGYRFVSTPNAQPRSVVSASMTGR